MVLAPPRYEHDSPATPALWHSSHMMLLIEIAACFAAIAGAGRLAAAEYTRLRKQKQMTQALTRAFQLAL